MFRSLSSIRRLCSTRTRSGSAFSKRSSCGRGSSEDENRAGRCLQGCAAREFTPVLGLRGGIEQLGPAAVFRGGGQLEGDRFRRRVEHDVKRWLPALQRTQQV